ncbi:lipoyl(octanoyl) transferase LipB [Pelagibacteraceae bacterium]|nr:lipoyl(octanoyl) transferase LipB [Pelagibacteraceae bacterium]
MKIEVKSEVKPIDYSISMRVLEKRAKDVFLGKKNELLWIIEHNPVYTAGSSAKSKDLIDKNIKVIKTNRGGKYTFHGPGQKVVYFVLNLNKRGKDIRKLINKIEKCLIDILSEYNVEAYTDKKNIGIWVGQKNNSKKIAAIGIKVKKWVAYHGFALNISNDLSKYKGIIPCGIKDKGITSLKEIGVKNFKNVESVIKKKFLNVFP